MKIKTFILNCGTDGREICKSKVRKEGEKKGLLKMIILVLQ